MLSWHPVLVLGIIGLGAATRRRPLVAWSLLGSLALAIVVNAGVLDWWAGVSFGARRFDGMWPALAIGLAVMADRVPAVVRGVLVAAFAVVNWLLLNAFVAGLVSRDGPVRPTGLLRVLGRVPLLPALYSWSPRKGVWVAGVLALSLSPLLVVARSRRPRRGPLYVAPALAGFTGVLLVTSAVAAAAQTPGAYDVHVFEAGYFVPQATRPPKTDRVISAGEDVWTLDWAFPGFLPAGRYVATIVAARSVTGQPSTLLVRADGHVVTEAAVGAANRAFRGSPFETSTGFVRLDFRVIGPPVRVTAVRLDPVRG